MPLPNAILFPRVMLPLYIFEPRYRKMLADALTGDRMFAVALLRPDAKEAGRNPLPYPVAGVGVIRASVAKSDGTSNVILEGVARVRICEYVRLRPYRVARIEPLASVAGTTPTKREPLLTTVTQLAKARARLGAELPKSVLNSMLSVQNVDHLSDLVSFTLLDNFYDKQAILETLDVNQRLHKLVGLLQKQIVQFQTWKTLQGRLPNDHVGHN